MAFEWITGSTPQFWKNYVALFDDEKQDAKKRFVVFEIETSTIEKKGTVMISISGIGVVDDGIAVGDFMHALVSGNDTEPVAQVTKNEGEPVVEAEAMIQFLNFIKDATLVSNNINSDIEVINAALKRLDLGRLKNDFMDIGVLYKRWKGINDDSQYSLTELCDALKTEQPDRNTSWASAYTMALTFLKLKTKLKI